MHRYSCKEYFFDRMGKNQLVFFMSHNSLENKKL